MKVTIEVPDDLYRQAKAEAALRGRKFKDLVEEGDTARSPSSPQNPRKSRLTTLMKNAKGAINSGVSDLASNPEHLTGLGRDVRDCYRRDRSRPFSIVERHHR